MKKTMCVLALLLASASAFAQGTVNFNNKVTASAINAPVYAPDGVTGLAGAAYLAQLYAGADANSLAPVGVAVVFKVNGYFGGGAVSTSLNPATGGTFQVRAWEAAGGATYDAAVAAGRPFGKSDTFVIAKLGDPAASPPGLPVDLVGLKSFSLVPEPSTVALGVLGAAALLAFRRK